jgi:hypothetical protein
MNIPLLPAYAATSRPVRVMSFGGGVQSVTIAAMQVLGMIDPYDVYLFANVGDDSENEETLEYFHNVFMPWAQKHGLNVQEVKKTVLKGKNKGTPAPTLLEAVMGNNKTIPIPIWLSGGAPGNRTCTTDWKIRVVNRWIKDHGYTHAVLGMGFSCDEAERAKPHKAQWHDIELSNKKSEKARKKAASKGKKPPKPRKLGFWLKEEYPLLKAGVFRIQCASILARVGLPMPPKSACWFCPFGNLTMRVEQKRNKPAIFKKACHVEARVNEKREKLGMDQVTLFPGGQLLEVAIPDYAPMFDFESGGCDTYSCNT